MKKYEAEKTFQTPYVILDPANNLFEIAGNSLPNNPHLFYLPILEWMDKFAKENYSECSFSFRFSYLNSSSKKMLHEIMKVLEKMHRAGKKVSVKWYYQPDDDDQLQAGTDIQKSFSFRVDCMEEEF